MIIQVLFPYGQDTIRRSVLHVSIAHSFDITEIEVIECEITAYIRIKHPDGLFQTAG